VRLAKRRGINPSPDLSKKSVSGQNVGGAQRNKRGCEKKQRGGEYIYLFLSDFSFLTNSLISLLLLAQSSLFSIPSPARWLSGQTAAPPCRNPETPQNSHFFTQNPLLNPSEYESKHQIFESLTKSTDRRKKVVGISSLSSSFLFRSPFFFLLLLLVLWFWVTDCLWCYAFLRRWYDDVVDFVTIWICCSDDVVTEEWLLCVYCSWWWWLLLGRNGCFVLIYWWCYFLCAAALKISPSVLNFGSVK
jgi:hypothetical protein